MPEICGQAMEVPDSILKSSDEALVWPLTNEEEATGDHDANILTPGAAISGCQIHYHISKSKIEKSQI